MKVARFVLKVVAAALAAAAAICCTIAFWDKIAERLGCAGGRLVLARRSSEYDDYVDWDEE